MILRFWTGSSDVFGLAARIDDKDSDCEDDDWQVESGGVTHPLRADRWWSTPGVLDQEDESGRCMGIKCNIWVRARRSVTSFIPLAVVGHTSWDEVYLHGQRQVGQKHVDLDLTLSVCFANFLRK